MRVIHLSGMHPGDDVQRGPSAVTIGSFDGVHLGHRQVIARLRSAAEALGVASAVVTFDRHPATIVRPESAPPLLTDTDQKLELLASTGIDLTALVHFDQERAAETAEDFVDVVLVGTLQARSVVVGYDFHFGAGRRGNVELLARRGAAGGFDVTGLRLFTSDASDTVPVSSTRIRQLVAEGAVDQAAVLLGRYHQVRGVVQPGDRRGRELGFPTANVGVPAGIAMPGDGVYAGRFAGSDGVWHPAALSVGTRPQFYDTAALSLLEAHLLDFEGDLYDQPAKVEFVARLRDQERFDSLDQLVAQMDRDVARARQILTPA